MSMAMASLFKSKSNQSKGESGGEGSTPPKWMGLGKIFSSVFASSDGTDTESDDDDDFAQMLSSDDKEEDASHKQLHKLNQDGLPGPVVGPKPIIPPTTKSKVTIEQLITQETFTREESKKLIKLIESRVVEASPLNREQNDVFNQNLEYLPFSPVQVSPEIRSMAIAESKKWLEEKKKSAPSSSNTIELGPCKLNTKHSQLEIENDIGSPVDLAKSYMQSKPPWQSPFLDSSSTLFSTPLTGSSKFSGSFIQGTFDHSLSSSRFLKRDYFSTSLWDPKEESSRRVRSRLSESAFESISSFTRPGSNSKLFERDVLESHKNLNFSPVDGKEPSNAGLDIISSHAAIAEATVNNSEPTLENNVLQSQELADKDQRFTKETAVNLNKGTEGIMEVVNLETSDPILPAFSEKNGAIDQDQKILTNEQPALEGNKGALAPENFADPKPHDGELHITSSLHGSANGPAVPSNMESEYESSINGGPTSSTVGPDVSDDKSLNGGSTQTDLKTLEPDKSPIRKGRKRIISGRIRGRGKIRGRGT